MDDPLKLSASGIAGDEWNSSSRKNAYTYTVNGTDVKMYTAPLNSES